MRDSLIPRKKTFRDGVFLALIIWLLVIPLTFMTQVFAPSVFVLLEGIGNFQYKPWIFLAPTACALIVALVFMPGYYSPSVIAGSILCCGDNRSRNCFPFDNDIDSTIALLSPASEGYLSESFGWTVTTRITRNISTVSSH
ncbi:hypothetical protein HF263_37370 [Rhizobium leguminosarum]|uniref:hypothetical protein n=1 Tax=Rhizobium leguminosarum TaxID=384 RepID=UPI001C91380A|nr:hypothetical protein [Rhizobium leguminosarum]MBY2996866.1 hypothetical protein [Rhizobium leguminosarum]MBY3033986.1 hypothetical protein [Rhizobium leguminosarum]MBY3061633.1 hypothetical protein [Rhizobium leguminosarum]